MNFYWFIPIYVVGFTVMFLLSAWDMKRMPSRIEGVIAAFIWPITILLLVMYGLSIVHRLLGDWFSKPKIDKPK